MEWIRGHNPKDCWTTKRDEESRESKTHVDNVEESDGYYEESGKISGFDIAALDIASVNKETVRKG